MQAHEVPTHVQAEDRVLLGFTFPQIVAMTAVCALAYGAYRFAPFGSSEVRLALAVLLGLGGLAMVVGKIGGRRLPLVAVDLLRYGLGARRYAGPPAELLRSEPPTTAQPARSGPGPLRLMASRPGRRLRRLALRRRRPGEHRNGRSPFRLRRWFRKRPRPRPDGHYVPGPLSRSRRSRPSGTWTALLIAALTLSVMATPGATLAQEYWRDEIEFELPEPAAGRGLFVEALSVSGDRAAVTLRAATDVDIRVRSYGGPEGDWLRFSGAARLAGEEPIDYSLPLHGPRPSLTFSWEDSLGQAGAVTLDHLQIPYPLPAVDGTICDVRIVSLGWTPAAVEGNVESDCVSRIEGPVDLETVAGHTSVVGTTLLEADVIAITGTLTATAGPSVAQVPFVPSGRTHFRLPVPVDKAIHPVMVGIDLQADLRIGMPPLTRLTHHPARTEYRTQTVSLFRPGTSRTVSETVTVQHADGTTSDHVVSATLSLPGSVVHEQVTLTIVHPEHIDAEIEARAPLTRSRDEQLRLTSHIGSDDPFVVLVLPEPDPPQPVEQRPVDEGLEQWFELLGWEWAW